MVRSTSSTADGPELHDVLRQLHRRVELREVHHAERARRRQRRELQVQPLEPGERAFRADQQVRGVGVRRTEMIEVVAGDLAQHLGKARFDLGLFAFDRDSAVCATELEIFAGAREASSSGPKRQRSPSDGHGVDREHVVHHVAVGDRARAAGVVAGHAAERRLRAGGHVDRKPQAVRRAASRSARPAPRRAARRAVPRLARRARRARSGTCEWSMTSAAPTVWPHCELPAPRGRTGTPCSAAIAMRRARGVRACAARRRRPVRSGRSRRRSSSGRARPRRTAPRRRCCAAGARRAPRRRRDG